MQAEEQARQLLLEAEKKMSPKGFFQSLFGHRHRTDEAIECYSRAGNLFKLAKRWRQANAAFAAAAQLHREQGARAEAADGLVAAAKCAEKYDAEAAVDKLLQAVEIYADLGRFYQAARLHANIAEIHEQNVELEKAVQHYEQAADYFKVEENLASAKKCLLKIAHYNAAEFKNYERAISIYQEVAYHDLKCPMLQYAAKEHLFRAVLCHLCVDVLNAKHAVDLYATKCPAFGCTRECHFLRRLVDALEDNDEKAFCEAVQAYDDISRLDTWQTKMLLTVKKQMTEQPNLL